MTRKLFQEDVNTILLSIMELIEAQIYDVYDIDASDMDQNIWTNEMMDKFDILFEPYSEGYRNYN